MKWLIAGNSKVSVICAFILLTVPVLWVLIAVVKHWTIPPLDIGANILMLGMGVFILWRESRSTR
jgi:hypothetical protein